MPTWRARGRSRAGCGIPCMSKSTVLCVELWVWICRTRLGSRGWCALRCLWQQRHTADVGEREIYRETVSEGERLYSVSSSEDDTVVSFY